MKPFTRAIKSQFNLSEVQRSAVMLRDLDEASQQTIADLDRSVWRIYP